MLNCLSLKLYLVPMEVLVVECNFSFTDRYSEKNEKGCSIKLKQDYNNYSLPSPPHTSLLPNNSPSPLGCGYCAKKQGGKEDQDVH